VNREPVHLHECMDRRYGRRHGHPVCMPRREGWGSGGAAAAAGIAAAMVVMQEQVAPSHHRLCVKTRSCGFFIRLFLSPTRTRWTSP
jgi:hypothetical protein